MEHPCNFTSAGTELRETAPESRAVAVGAARLDVVFLLSTLMIGGSERKIVRLAARLAAHGVRAGIACLNSPYTLAEEIRADVPLWKLDRRGKLSLDTIRQLRGIVVRHRPTTLVGVNLYPSLYVALTAMCSPQPRPHTVALVNTSTFGQDSWRRDFYRWLLRIMGRTVHGCAAQRALWFAPGGRAWRRSSVIYNGVDLEHFAPGTATGEADALRARCGIPPGRFVIGSVGRLAPEKNQAALLDVLAHLHSAGVDAHLLIAGEGPLRAELTQRAVVLGIARRVSLIGEIADVRPVLAAMDVFVLPSVAVESFSNAALEAMATARPVILSDIGGAREMIDDGVEGFIIGHTEMRARLPSLLAALCADTRRRARLGEAGRRRVERCFSLDVMVTNYLELLRDAGEKCHV